MLRIEDVLRHKMTKGKKLKNTVYWIGKVGERDDFGARIGEFFIDGATRQGPWAIMSEETFERWGMGLGQGTGQKYQRQADGRWLKVEG